MEEYKFRQKLFVDKLRLEQYQSTIEIHYPALAEIILNLKFTYNGVVQSKEEITLKYTPKDKAFFKIECINADCVYSDLELKDEIQKMIGKKETHSVGTKTCNGYQDYRRYLSRGNHCLTDMEYEIKLKYK
jgi:hypothetical protein